MTFKNLFFFWFEMWHWSWPHSHMTWLLTQNLQSKVRHTRPAAALWLGDIERSAALTSHTCTASNQWSGSWHESYLVMYIIGQTLIRMDNSVNHMTINDVHTWQVTVIWQLMTYTTDKLLSYPSISDLTFYHSIHLDKLL